MRVIAKETPQTSCSDITLLKLLPYPPGAYELVTTALGMTSHWSVPCGLGVPVLRAACAVLGCPLIGRGFSMHLQDACKGMQGQRSSLRRRGPPRADQQRALILPDQCKPTRFQRDTNDCGPEGSYCILRSQIQHQNRPIGCVGLWPVSLRKLEQVYCSEIQRQFS